MATTELNARAAHHAHHHHEGDAAARDPVCGMKVDPATARHRAEHAGHEYLFCSAKCRERFVAEPARYLAPAPVQPPPAPSAQAGETLWTCPMHPEIVRKEPGSCPICSMALEPMTPTAEAENPELRDMSRRFWVSLALAVPLLVMITALGGSSSNETAVSRT